MIVSPRVRKKRKKEQKHKAKAAPPTPPQPEIREMTSGLLHRLPLLCLQTVDEIRGHPEDLIVLSQQSSGERGRWMQANLPSGNKSAWWIRAEELARRCSTFCSVLQLSVLIVVFTLLCFTYNTNTISLHSWSICFIVDALLFNSGLVSPAVSQQYRSTTLPAFKYYVTCACLIFCGIFVVQVLVLPK